MSIIDVDDITAIENAIDIWKRDINTARTVVIQVENRTSFALRIASHHHNHGGFAEPPDIEVPAAKAWVFGSTSASYSLFTGTEGSVTYSIEGANAFFTVRWNNPFLGTNACSASLDGERAAAFAATSVCGSGNEAVMKYELRQIQDPRLVRPPDYGFVRLEGYILQPDLSWDPDGASPVGRPIIGLTSYWSVERGDNFATTNPAFLRLATLDPDYTRYRLEGYLFAPTAPQPPGTIALRSWWSASRGDNFATANRTFTQPLRQQLEPDYEHYRLEGYIYPPDGTQPNDTVPLYAWYSPSRSDNLITTDPRYHP